MNDFFEDMARFHETMHRESVKDTQALLLMTPFLDRELTDEQQAFLDERKAEWARREERARQRDAEERARAMTVGRLMALLADMPEDAPVRVREHYSWGPEDEWAAEHHVELRSDGSVFIGE